MGMCVVKISLILFGVQLSGANPYPETFLTTPELIKFWGYPAETHKVLTRDGYILTMHRIPFGRHQSSPKNATQRPVFYLQHPLMGSSSDWVINLPNQSLGFMLADHGYDVWLGNVRGNTYSQSHATLSKNSKEFWDFSIDEHALYDFPAMIEYVLKETNHSQLFYVGHSQGTMMAFAGLSNNTQLQTKIKINFALAPITRIRHVDKNIVNLAFGIKNIKAVFDRLGTRDIASSSASARKAIDDLCKSLPNVCVYLNSIKNNQIGGSSPYLNISRLPVYFTHAPSGTSAKNFLHRLQLVNSGKFCKYDYGECDNLKVYGSQTPPTYDVSKVDVPTVVFSGSKDSLSTPDDVQWTLSKLPNVMKNFTIDGYNHGCFLIATNTGSAINKRIMDIVDQL